VLLPSVGRRVSGEGKLAGWFLLGAVAGASVTATLLLVVRALLSPVPAPATLAIGVSAACGIALLALVRGGCPLWQTRRQIASDLVVGRAAPGAFVFALELGTGLVTYLPSCAPHVLAVLLVTLPVSVRALAVAAVGFGIGRSAGFLARTFVGARDELEAQLQRGVSFLVRTTPAAVFAMLVAVQLR
jgi:hypothetical protein